MSDRDYVVTPDGVRRVNGTEGNSSGGESVYAKVMRARQAIEDRQGMFFKPKEGLNHGRVMPSWLGKDGPWHKECINHYKVGPNRTTITCLRYWDKPCPVCDLIERLCRSNNARDLNIANDMRIQYGYIINWAVRNDPDGIVKPWNLNGNMFLEISAGLMDPDVGDFSHPRTGFDFQFMYKKNGGPPVYVTDWRQKILNLDTFLKPRTRQEIRAILAGEEE